MQRPPCWRASGCPLRSPRCQISASSVRRQHSHGSRTARRPDLRGNDACRPAARTRSSFGTIRCIKSALDLDYRHTHYGDQRGGLCRSTYNGRQIWTSDRRPRFRLHFEHGNDRRNGRSCCQGKGSIAATVAGAVLSTIATIIQMALVLAITSMATLLSLAVPLICAGMAATAYGTAFTVLALRQKTDTELQGGRAFSLWTAFVFALPFPSFSSRARTAGSVRRERHHLRCSHCWFR